MMKDLNLVLCLLICSNNLLIWMKSAAYIYPLYKKDNRALPSNYRPVSLTCVPGKLYEYIVRTNIMAHLDEHTLLADSKRAFRKNSSREARLFTVINDCAKILDAGG